MRRKPERVAWTVLWAAFIAFCLLMVSIPVSVRAYVRHSFEERETQLQRIAGTPLVRRAQNGLPFGVTETAVVAPGDEIVLDASDEAILDLFDRSHITLYSNTILELNRARSPRFEMSDLPNEVVVTLTSGLTRVGVALPGERDTLFKVQTPHTSVLLEEGSYRIEVASESTQVTVLRGHALLGSGASSLALSQGMRSRIDLDGTIAEPMPAARNLIVNGDFQEPLSSGWLTDTIVYTTTIEPPRVAVVEDGTRRAVRLVRRETDDGIHTEVSIRQRLDQDVQDFVRLEILFDVMLNYQSLSGGGLQSSEFPVIVRLDYKDQWGNDQFWTHGFYYQNERGYPIAPDLWGRPRGEQISRGVWYPYESGNLMDLLGDIQPFYLTAITIYASGWNYDSLVSEVQLIVE
jgi:hypothetical protein